MIGDDVLELGEKRLHDAIERGRDGVSDDDVAAIGRALVSIIEDRVSPNDIPLLELVIETARQRMPLARNRSFAQLVAMTSRALALQERIEGIAALGNTNIPEIATIEGLRAQHREQ